MNVKENGLHVQFNYFSCAQTYLASSPTTMAPPFQTFVFVVNAPVDIVKLYDSLRPTGLEQTDYKLHLRQSKEVYYVQNNANMPVYYQRTWFKVRKDIPTTVATSFQTLISLNTVNTDASWMLPVTAGSIAQRYLKFGRTSYKYLKPGQIFRWSQSVKFRSPLQVTADYEANVIGITGTKYTRGCITKVIPGCLVLHTEPGPNYPTGISGFRPAYFNVCTNYIRTTSMYKIGDLDPSQAYTTPNLPPTGAQAQIFAAEIAQAPITG